MRFTQLTREQFTSIPEWARTERQANWARIVTELGRAHHNRYHAALEVDLIEWANTRSTP